MVEIPAYDELALLGGVRCSWGVWGEQDVFGCLNLLTAERVAAASRLVERGAVFSLNWSVELPDPPLFGRPSLRHEVRGNPGVRSQDDVLQDFNTQASTQWDGFRHVRRERHGYYGGVADAEHGVHHWARRGIAGRAVLADVSRWRASVGRAIRHGTPDPVEPEELTETLRAQRVTVVPGDILLVRTGWLGWYQGLDAEQRTENITGATLASPGLRPSEETARVLWNLHIAAIAADNPALELRPIGAHLDPVDAAAINADPLRDHEVRLHTHLLPMLGMPIGELFVLDELAADCARDGRYECFFTSAPLNLHAGVATPPNALAIK